MLCVLPLNGGTTAAANGGQYACNSLETLLEVLLKKLLILLWFTIDRFYAQAFSRRICLVVLPTNWAMEVWKDILCSYDLLFGDGAMDKPQVNVLVKDFKLVNDNLWETVVCRPEGGSSSCSLQEFPRFQTDEEIATKRFQWEHPTSPDALGKTFLVGAKMLTGQAVDFMIPAECIVMPLAHVAPGPLKILELFAGGVGGWRMACDFLSNACSMDFRVLAVEADPLCAFHYACSHGVPLVAGPNFDHFDFMQCSSHAVLVDHVENHAWWPVAARFGADIITISSPCQPWSSAGAETGLNSEGGCALAHAIALAKFTRPKLIVLEQVLGFMTHAHHRLVVNLLLWAGYQIVFARALDFAAVGPSARPRWIAIARRIVDAHTGHGHTIPALDAQQESFPSQHRCHFDELSCSRSSTSALSGSFESCTTTWHASTFKETLGLQWPCLGSKELPTWNQDTHIHGVLFQTAHATWEPSLGKRAFVTFPETGYQCSFVAPGGNPFSSPLFGRFSGFRRLGNCIQTPG